MNEAQLIAHPGDEPAIDLAANEATTLTQFLDYYRHELLRRAADLTSDQLAATPTPSTLSLGGLVKHMAAVEDWWFEHRFAGRPEPEPGASTPPDEPDWDFTSAAADAPTQLQAWFVASCARSRAVAAAADSLDQRSALVNAQGEHWNLRWIMVHMIEEYARHCGHADLIREAIDGSTG